MNSTYGGRVLPIRVITGLWRGWEVPKRGTPYIQKTGKNGVVREFIFRVPGLSWRFFNHDYGSIRQLCKNSKRVFFEIRFSSHFTHVFLLWRPMNSKKKFFSKKTLLYFLELILIYCSAKSQVCRHMGSWRKIKKLLTGWNFFLHFDWKYCM